MRRTKLIAISVVLVIAMLAVVTFAETQQPRDERGTKPDRQAVKRGGAERMTNWLVKQLGLTEKEKVPVTLQVRKLFALRRREMPGLKRLKALQKNEKASAEEIAAGLKRFRNNLADARAQIIREEKKLVDMKEITPERELTLTILGILDNGKSLPRIPTGRPRTRKKEGAERLKMEKKHPPVDPKSVF